MSKNHEVTFIYDSAQIKARMALLEASDLNLAHLSTVGVLVTHLLIAREKMTKKKKTNLYINYSNGDDALTPKNLVDEETKKQKQDKIVLSALGQAIKHVATFIWGTSKDVNKPLSFSRCEILRRSFASKESSMGLAVLIVASSV